MAEKIINCPVDNRPCPHLTMLERQKDEPIPEIDVVSEEIGEEQRVGTGEIEITHDFNWWKVEDEPIFIEPTVVTGRTEMIGWDPFRAFEYVESLTNRNYIAKDCAARALNECGVIVHIFGKEAGKTN